MKRKIKVGDLVYIPSDVLLYNETKTHKLEQPINLLITGKKADNYEVFFNGNSWYVGRGDLYLL